MIESLQSAVGEAVSVMHESSDRAQTTVDAAGRAGESLGMITQVVSTINDMNTMIAGSAEEQESTTEEINKNVVTITSLADQTQDGTRQLAASSDELARLSSELRGLVTQFRV
jgi:methyl-accepting chemotaxis protein